MIYKYCASCYLLPGYREHGWELIVQFWFIRIYDWIKSSDVFYLKPNGIWIQIIYDTVFIYIVLSLCVIYI